MNNRLNIINNIVDNYIINDNMDNLLKKYKDDLEHYIYIDSVDIFSTLHFL